MNPEINLTSILANEFKKAGYAITENTDSVFFPSLNLTIKASLTNMVDAEEKGSSVMIDVCCQHPEKFADGITEAAISFGDNINKAAAVAFNHWIAGDFPPIHDYLCQSGHKIGSYMEMASHSGELNQFIGWDCFLGPLMITTQTREKLETKIGDNDEFLVYKSLFQAMTDELLANPGIYYIRTFMSKIDNEKIDCDCRVNYSEWEHGKSYLLDFLKNYEAPAGIYYIKQNFLLVSKDVTEIQSQDLLAGLHKEISKLNPTTATEMKKKWWEFWK